MSEEQVAGPSRVASSCRKVVSIAFRCGECNRVSRFESTSIGRRLAIGGQWPVEIYRLDTAGERASWNAKRKKLQSGATRSPLTTDLRVSFFAFFPSFLVFSLACGNAASGS